MTSPSDEFFATLHRRGHDPQVGRATGSIRFEITHRGKTHYQRLEIDKGHLAVTQDSDDADCVVRADQSVLDMVTTGRANAMSALLRGTLSADGNPELMVIFRRLLPPLPNNGAHRPVETVAGR